MLKGEQKSQVLDLVAQDSFKSLLVFLEMLVKHQEEQVVKHRITPGREAELHYLKAKAEGARALQTMFVSEIAGLKKSK